MAVKKNKSITMEPPQFISLDEIVGIQYKCSNCGITLSVPRGKWNTIQYRCPCRECRSANGGNWVWLAEGKDEAKELMLLLMAITKLSELKQNGVGCTLTLAIRTNGNAKVGLLRQFPY